MFQKKHSFLFLFEKTTPLFLFLFEKTCIIDLFLVPLQRKNIKIIRYELNNNIFHSGIK